MNFSPEANLRLGVADEHGEQVLVAVRDIEGGEELTVPPDSDRSYEEKMKGVRK